MAFPGARSRLGFPLALTSALVVAAVAHADPAMFQASFRLERERFPAHMPYAASATGSGSIGAPTPSVASPVALPQSAFGITTESILVSYPMYLSFYATSATFVNEAGNFFAGGGPAAGMGTLSHPRNGTPGGAWVIHEGASGFGGALGLLGRLGAHRIFLSGPNGFEGTSSWNVIRALGRSSMDPLNPYTNTDVFFATESGTQPNITYTKFALGTGWTTGSARVFVKTHNFFFTTTYSDAGYDTVMQTPSGRRSRHVRLVTPSLTQRRHDAVDREGAHFGVLKLHIVPEPSAALLFAAGAGVLVLLHRVSRRG